jgi:hypothetical protein
MLGLLRPGGFLTYFAYVGTRVARQLFSSAQESRRHMGVDGVMQAYRAAYAASHQKVWANLPPARVWQLKLPAQPVTQHGAAAHSERQPRLRSRMHTDTRPRNR